MALANSNLATQKVRVRPDVDEVFYDARYHGRRPIRPRLALRRADLTVPVAPTAAPTDADVFESPDGTVRYALPRYALQFDRVGNVDEPRIVIADRDGTPTLVMTLNEVPSPASGQGIQELPHALAVALKYQQPVQGGGSPVIQERSFPTVLLDPPTETIVTAERPLTTNGELYADPRRIGLAGRGGHARRHARHHGRGTDRHASGGQFTGLPRRRAGDRLRCRFDTAASCPTRSAPDSAEVVQPSNR